MRKTKIALTVGDSTGIGPEIAVKVASNQEIIDMADIILYGSPNIIEVASARYANNKKFAIVATGDLKFDNLTIGELSAESGKVAYDTIVKATKDTIAKKVDAIVTCPANKAAINLANIPFTGHTELIAELAGEEEFVMMQSSENLRIVFVTTHIPLADVAKSITTERIIKITELLNNTIISEGIQNPKIAIAAINPHAGEDGFMGQEDEIITKPAIAKLAEKGLNISGPFPSDTLFIKETLNQFDGIVSMYHDQGHIPFKMLAFDKGVNSTLGLPILRTSVDHGTAFNIAWQGIADTGSLTEAIKLAIKRSKSQL